MLPFQLVSMLLKTGLNVPKSQVTSEINPTVDPVGLTEPPKLLMIDYVLQMVLLNFYQFLILQDVVDFYPVSLWDVTEDKLEPHGLGSNIPESLPEEIMVTKLNVIHTPCQNVTITSKTHLTQNVPMSHKSNQPAVNLVLPETELIINPTNITEKPHTLWLHHQKSNKIC